MDFKALIGGKQSGSACIREIHQCTTFHFAVAWAQAGTLLSKVMKDENKKAGRLVVGTQGGFTDPEFIEQWEGAGIRVHLKDGELFHPKIMLFEKPEGWSAIIGSTNATHGGLNRDAECGVLIRADVNEADEQFEKLQFAIELWWSKGSKVTPELLAEVAALKARRYARPSHPTQSIVENLPFDTWEHFLSRIGDTPSDVLTDRIKILSYAKSLSKQAFHLLDRTDLQKYLGTIGPRTGEPDWRFFGHVTLRKGPLPALIGITKSHAPSTRKKISECLATIPLTGPVSKMHFGQFQSRWTALTGSTAAGTASRLLAMRRPDVFLGLTSASRKLFCEEWGGAVYKTGDLRHYWDAVVHPIQNSPWWNAPRPKRGLAMEVWDGRAALLDAIYYRN